MVFLKKFKGNEGEIRFALEILSFCLLWNLSSALQSVVNKYTLQHYPFPITVALSSCFNSVIYCFVFMRIFRITHIDTSASYIVRRILPIAIGRAVALAGAYFALWKVSVSYAQTVKSTMPIFTVFLARFLLNEHFRPSVYMSLVLIIFGVFITTMTELEFDALGLCSSLMSTCIFAYLNILAKRVFDETRMQPTNLLVISSQVSAMILFPLWLCVDASRIWNSKATNQPIDPKFLFYLVISGVCSFIQNLCAFSLIHKLSPLSYSVANTMKRIFVIALSITMLKNPVTPLNACGMLVSTFGVLIYNKNRIMEGARFEELAHDSTIDVNVEREWECVEEFRPQNKSSRNQSGGRQF